MCNRCLVQCTRTEIEQPEVDELWALFRAAHEQYQSQIVNGNKLYHRFVNDFISYHLPYFGQDEHRIRMHISNVSSLYELLTERHDLINRFFVKENFTYEDCQAMLREFNTVELVYDHSRQMAVFNDDQIILLMKFINEEELFANDIDESELREFFSCTLREPLVARKTTWLLLLLNALAHEKFLVRGWQKLIVDNQLLKSNKARKPITKSAISSNISRKRNVLCQSGSELDPFKGLIKKLKEYVK